MCNNLQGVFPNMIPLATLLGDNTKKVAKDEKPIMVGKYPVDCCTCVSLKYKRF